MTSSRRLPVAWLSVLTVCLMAAPAMAAEAGTDLSYARVYAARVQAEAGQTLADLEQIARTQGSIEVIGFTAEAGPSRPSSRVLVNAGEAGLGYPGFSVRAQAMLAKQKAAGKLEASSDGTSATSQVDFNGKQAVMNWSLPTTKGEPLSVSATVDGEPLATTTIHPMGAKAGSSLPDVITTTVAEKNLTIVQVFEYLEGQPAPVETAPIAPEAPIIAPQAAAGGEAPLTDEGFVVTEQAVFDSDLTGLSWSWDTKWWPGDNEEPGGFPVQIRILMGVGADINSHIQGGFGLEYVSSLMQAGAATGDLAMDFGAELSAQGALDLGIVDPITFDIPYIPQFDLRVYDQATFNSFLLDTTVEISDATGRQRIVEVDIVDLVLADLIDIPGLGGGITIDGALSATGTMTAESISMTDGNVFTAEGQALPVTIGPEGYQTAASYNEDFEGQATLIAYPVMYIELLWWTWDLPVFDLPWDIISGPIDLDFSNSGLDFPRPMLSLTLTIKNGDAGTVILDPEPADPCAMEYPAGATVTLEAVPNPGETFGWWEIYDPNYPSDRNHAVEDHNLVTQIVMTDDLEVRAVFECGSAMGGLLPMVGVLCGLLGLVAYRRRR